MTKTDAEKAFAAVVSSSAAGSSASFIIKQGEHYYRIENVQPDFLPVPEDETMPAITPADALEAIHQSAHSNFADVSKDRCKHQLLSHLTAIPGAKFGQFRREWLVHHGIYDTTPPDRSLYEAEHLLVEVWTEIKVVLNRLRIRRRVNDVLRSVHVSRIEAIRAETEVARGGVALVAEVHEDDFDVYLLLEARHSGTVTLLVQLSGKGFELPSPHSLVMTSEHRTRFFPEATSRSDAWAVMELPSAQLLVNSMFILE